MNTLLLIPIIVGVLLIFVFLTIMFQLFRLWFIAFLSGAGVKYSEVVSMRFRKVDANEIVINKIRLQKAGDTWIQTKDLEACLVAGGKVGVVTSAYIAGKLAGVALSWKSLVKHDLEGDDILKMVNDAINTDDPSSIVPLLEDPIE